MASLKLSVFLNSKSFETIRVVRSSLFQERKSGRAGIGSGKSGLPKSFKRRNPTLQTELHCKAIEDRAVQRLFGFRWQDKTCTLS
jgi:hypothetical protein